MLLIAINFKAIRQLNSLCEILTEYGTTVFYYHQSQVFITNNMCSIMNLCFVTDAGHCANGFLDPTDLRDMTARLKIHNVTTKEKEQRLFPNITFTCNGAITKWIVGAGNVNISNSDNSQLQIWRRGSSSNTTYNKIGASILIPNETSHPNVHEYIPNPPLEFQEGDILGVYQPDDTDNQLKLYYQENTGPLNYLRSNINPPPPSWFALDIPTTQLYYPLVSAIVSTGNNNTVNYNVSSV